MDDEKEIVEMVRKRLENIIKLHSMHLRDSAELVLSRPDCVRATRKDADIISELCDLLISIDYALEKKES